MGLWGIRVGIRMPCVHVEVLLHGRMCDVCMCVMLVCVVGVLVMSAVICHVLCENMYRRQLHAMCIHCVAIVITTLAYVCLWL